MKAIVYCMFLVPWCVLAQEWQYLGLGSEGITTIAVDWSNSNIIYAGSGSGFSSGKVGGIFKSTNSGATWDTLIRGVTTREVVIHPTNPNILYATLGINSLTIAGIIKSIDGGTNWIKADSGIWITWEEGPGPLVMDIKHPDTLYTGTSGPFGGVFYRSTNGGMNWYCFAGTILRDGVTALAIHPDSSNVIYAGTAWSGNIFKSSDHGITWNLTGFKTGITNSIQFGSKSSTIYIGSYWSDNYPVGIFKTTDAGVTWSNPKLGLPDSANIGKIEAVRNTSIEKVYCIANWRDSGGIYKSTQGQGWEKIGVDNRRVSTIQLFNGKLYAGYGGVYVLNILNSVSDNPYSSYQDFNLCNNFPNPFNPTTKIIYKISTNTNVLLEIYDIQGRKIKILIHKHHSPGKYSVNWNGENDQGIHAGSGVYFYVMRTEKHSAAKKMIYLR